MNLRIYTKEYRRGKSTINLSTSYSDKYECNYKVESHGAVSNAKGMRLITNIFMSTLVDIFCWSKIINSITSYKNVFDL